VGFPTSALDAQGHRPFGLADPLGDLRDGLHNDPDRVAEATIRGSELQPAQRSNAGAKDATPRGYRTGR